MISFSYDNHDPILNIYHPYFLSSLKNLNVDLCMDVLGSNGFEAFVGMGILLCVNLNMVSLWQIMIRIC